MPPAPPTKPIVSPTVVGVVVAIVVGVAGWLLWPKSEPAVPNPSILNQDVCPRDAKLCSDGTSVGRSGPDCEFDACPGELTNISNTNSDSNQNVNLSNEPPDDWELYSNTELGFAIQLPVGWEVDEGRSTMEEIVLTDGAELAIRESIKSTSTTQTLEEWTFVYQGEPNYTVSDYRLDGAAAKRVRYGDGSDLIGVKHNEQLIVVTVGRMDDNGMLATFNLLP